MIYFIPDWTAIYKKQSNVDDVVGKIRAFMQSDLAYKVIIPDYIPELRYFLHRFDLLESDFISVYDVLQCRKKKEQRRLDFSELSFPEGASFSYTPFNILVLHNNILIGKIHLGEASQILEVSRYLENNESIIDIYDESGFLSSRKYLKNNVHYYTEVLDSDEIWIFKEYQDTGVCHINQHNSKGLVKPRYENIDSLHYEIIENILKTVKDNDAIVVSLSDNNFKALQTCSFLPFVTLSLFQERFSLSSDSNPNFVSFFESVKNILVDQPTTLDRMYKILNTSKNDHLFHLPPYDTRFDLSISQELGEEIIFLDARELEKERIKEIVEELVLYLIQVDFTFKNNRCLKFILRTQNNSSKEVIQEIIDEILLQYFPEETDFLSKNFTKVSGENGIDEVLKDDKEVSLVEKARSAWVLKSNISELELFKIIHETRLIIDLSLFPDLFTQIAGISAGIPQINSVNTPYVQHNKNGLILSEKITLGEGLVYYLDTLRHWQEARAYAAQQIKKYSGVELQEKLNNILRVGGK